MKRSVSLLLALFIVLVISLPGFMASAEVASSVNSGFDSLPDDAFSGKYTEFGGKDGSTTLVYDNGGVMTKYKDGSATSVDYKGNMYSTSADGSYSVRTPDGYSATDHGDGRMSWTTPDGMTTTVNPDGSSSETFSNGLIKEYDKDSGLVGVGFVGSDERISADEYGEYKDGRISGPNGASMEVSDGGNTVTIVTPSGTRYEYTSSGIADSEDGRKDITTVTEPDGTTAVVTETTSVNRGDDGASSGTTVSTVKEITANGNKFESEYIVDYDTNGDPVENTQNVTQFTGEDGTTYWTDNNSKAVEYNDPKTGERFCLDANGNITDLVSPDVNVKTTYDADGNAVSSEWKWSDGAGYTLSDGVGTFVTSDGTTYTTDGNGNVYENGTQIKKDGEWVNGSEKTDPGKTSTAVSGTGSANTSKVENPFEDYYEKYTVEVTNGGTIVSSEYSGLWGAEGFNIYVTDPETEDEMANGFGTVLIERPSLYNQGSSVSVCHREDMSVWAETKIEDMEYLYASKVSFDGLGSIPERNAVYGYWHDEKENVRYLHIYYDSCLPVNNVPNVYIEYSMGFDFPGETELSDALAQIAPYDDAAKKTHYNVKWDYKIRKEPEDAKKDKKEDEEEKTPRGFVDPVAYFAMTSDTDANELQRMMYTIDEYYLVPTSLNCYGAFIYEITHEGEVAFDAQPVVADGKTTFTISGGASSDKGSESINLTLKNFGRRGSYYKFQADISGKEILDSPDYNHRENDFNYQYSANWLMTDGIPNASLTFSSLLTDENGKEYINKYSALITFRIAGIKPTARSEAYLKEHDIKSTVPTGGGNGSAGTVGGIIGLGLLTSVIGSVAGAVVSTAGSVAGSVAGSIAGEAAGAAASGLSGFDFGPHISVDDDGDLNVKDPATGEERLYTSNGDGTYTNPLTGATYTPEELKDSLESREENADLIRQDEAVRKKAVSEQAEDNKNVSFYDAEAKAEKAAAEKEAEHELYKEKMYFKHGVEEGDDKGVKKDILEKTGKEYEEQAKYEARAEYADAGYKTAKETKQAADIAIDVMAEIDKTGMGKVVKDGYAVASSAAGNMGEVMAGDKTVGAALTQTVVDSTVELAKNHTDSAAGKYAANIFGDSAKEMSKEALKGGSLEDIRKAGEKGAISGAVNATVDVAFDGAGELASSAMKNGEKAIGRVLGQEVTKETAAEAAKTLAGDVTKELVGSDDDD